MTARELMIEAADRLDVFARKQWPGMRRPDFCALCSRDIPNHTAKCLIIRLRTASPEMPVARIPEGYALVPVDGSSLMQARHEIERALDFVTDEARLSEPHDALGGNLDFIAIQLTGALACLPIAASPKPGETI